MTNYEFYKSEIEAFLLGHGHTHFAVIDNTVVECNAYRDCTKCELYGIQCDRKEWLNKERNTYTIPLDTPVDTKVLVSENGEAWYKRYFSHFSEKTKSPYACFGDGSNSWSAKGIYEWRYCKLWKEGDEND